MDVSRREFLHIGSVSLASLGFDGGVQAQTESDSTDYQTVAHLVGAESGLPAPDSQFFDNKQHYGYLYEARDTGATYYIDETRDGWATLAVQGSRLELVAQDLSTVTANDGQLYRHDGSSTITADGAGASAAGYYCWSETDAEWKTVVTF
jgi:hypothetical protein